MEQVVDCKILGQKLFCNPVAIHAPLEDWLDTLTVGTAVALGGTEVCRKSMMY